MSIATKYNIQTLFFFKLLRNIHKIAYKIIDFFVMEHRSYAHSIYTFILFPHISIKSTLQQYILYIFVV